MISIDLIRHGETEFNISGRVQGQLDIPLNQPGRFQCALLANRYKDIPIDSIYTSDLSRTHETATILAAHHPNVTITSDPRLREREQRHSHLKGVESLESMYARCLQFYNDVLLPLISSSSGGTNGDKRIVIVSHGALLSVLIRQVLLNKYKYSLAPNVNPASLINTSVTRAVVNSNHKGTLVSWSDDSHLQTHGKVENADEICL
ncbi:hypothetical protein E3P92_02724 [Wallemia ichthyophaga]|uniref:Uncharacterized protein n=1 Tax=Wallemia ichthyophaga TaxID=245174 RepID=A0A4T0HYT8_WALIC|nr:hypothetical protein E3P98_03315 [Wallemia ichthyophaga]TIA88085.1 hypothetical protein E3P97_03656 [Wallemia ichthyophaga]TIA98538.1 hypothetical protein E3P95_02385 [Wallemia ichthyophaga]TIB09156.1 hypothetical protein E3P93_03271 [Wallemia ichthyophaga]TIB09395.1 hypothetical protein E3P90_03270 [Wallemia ichthyophaga]